MSLQSITDMFEGTEMTFRVGDVIGDPDDPDRRHEIVQITDEYPDDDDKIGHRVHFRDMTTGEEWSWYFLRVCQQVYDYDDFEVIERADQER